MGHSGIPTKIYAQTGASKFTVSIDKVDPFEFDLKAVEREGKADPVILEKGIVASVLSKNGDLSADSFNFTTGPEGPPLPDYGILSRGATEFAGEDGLGDEMPEDLPQGLVVYQEYDLML